MTRFTLTVLLCGALLAGCATQPPAARNKLTKSEIRTLKPEIATHLKCVARKVVAYAGGSSDVKLVVDTAARNCRNDLRPFASKLNNFNLTELAQRSYVRAIERASVNIVTDRLLKARSRAVRRKTSNTRKIRTL